MSQTNNTVKPIESTDLFGLRVVDLQRRYRLGYVPAKALHDDLATVISIIAAHPEYPEPCPMLHEVAAKAAAEMDKEWVMHMVRETCRQTKEAILADLKQSLPNA